MNYNLQLSFFILQIAIANTVIIIILSDKVTEMCDVLDYDNIFMFKSLSWKTLDNASCEATIQ